MSDLSGIWSIEVKFLRGEARHVVELEQEGAELKGRCRSQFGEQELRGTVEGDAVRMRMGVRYQACGAGYGFSGKIAGDTMKGEVDLGEYWTGEWEGKRVG